MHVFTAHVTAIAACLIVATGLASAQSSYRLSGQVRDVCGLVVPGARVTARSETGTTRAAVVDGMGRYVMPGLPDAGPWEVSAELRGFERAVTAGIQLAGDAGELELDLRLARPPDFVGTIDVRATHGEAPLPHELVGTATAGGRGAGGAQVTLRHETLTGVVERCQSDERGRFAFWVNTAGPWRLSVEAPGFRPFTRAGVVLRPRERLTVDVQLDRLP